MSSPISTRTFSKSNDCTPVCCEYAAISANDVNTADPMAKPLPVAAVVFPSESKASVRSRTSGSRCACSAIPPALSATGP